MAIKNTQIHMRRMKSDQGEEDDTSCEKSMSQVAMNGKRRSTPTKCVHRSIYSS
jgi:hypothetical protein